MSQEMFDSDVTQRWEGHAHFQSGKRQEIDWLIMIVLAKTSDWVTDEGPAQSTVIEVCKNT